MDINNIFNKNFGKIAAEKVTVEEPTMQEPLVFNKPVQQSVRPSENKPVENIPHDEPVVTKNGLSKKINRANDLAAEIFAYAEVGFMGKELKEAAYELSSLLSDIKSEMLLRQIS